MQFILFVKELEDAKKKNDTLLLIEKLSYVFIPGCVYCNIHCMLKLLYSSFSNFVPICSSWFLVVHLKLSVCIIAVVYSLQLNSSRIGLLSELLYE